MSLRAGPAPRLYGTPATVQKGGRMVDDGNPEWRRIAEERRYIFTPAWFKDLLGARLSLGDTFWIGNIGTALIYVPGSFLLTVLGPLLLPLPLSLIFLGAVYVALACFFVALSFAMFRVARATPTAGLWRWVGFGLTTLHALAIVTIVASFIIWGVND